MNRPLIVAAVGLAVVAIAIELNYGLNIDTQPTENETKSSPTSTTGTARQSASAGASDSTAPAPAKTAEPGASAPATRGTQPAADGTKGAADELAAMTPPSFDVVRVNPQGDSVMAGRAAPGATVLIMESGKVIGQVVADNRGEWVFVPENPLNPGDRELTLEMQVAGQPSVQSEEAVVLVVPEKDKDIAGRVAETAKQRKPLAMKVPRKGSGPSVVLQKPAAAPAATAQDSATAAAGQQTKPQAVAAAQATGGAAAPSTRGTTMTAPGSAAKQTMRAPGSAAGTTATAPTGGAAAPASGTMSAPTTSTVAGTTASGGSTTAAAGSEADGSGATVTASGARKLTPVRAKPQPAGAVSRLTVDTVDYDDAGRLTISGQARNSALVQVYLNNDFIGRATAGAQDRWVLSPGDAVAPGLYALRADQVDARGKVVSRVMFPFSRAEPLTEIASGDFVIVQPGNSLWRIARRTYGQGTRYTVIFEANKEQIKDADLIYPGQIFAVPPSN